MDHRKNFEDRLLAVERATGWLQQDLLKERAQRNLLDLRMSALEDPMDHHPSQLVQGTIRRTPWGKFMIKPGFDQVGRTGVCYCSIWFGQWWAIIQWDTEEDPDVYKLSGLDFGPSWQDDDMLREAYEEEERPRRHSSASDPVLE